MRRLRGKILIASAALAALLVVVFAVAQASPVEQFSFQLTNVKPDGRFTLIFRSRMFDTTGGVPPALLENYDRFPRGAKLRPEFLSRRFFCDGPALRDALNNHFSSTPFTQRVANLKPFIRELSRSRSKADRRALANAIACDRARIGDGTAQIDARASIPALTDLIPSRFSMFFSRATVRGAVAGFTVLGAADERSPIVKREPIVASVHTALNANFFNDPTPDGLYGYKLVFPTGRINGLNVSIAEIDATTHGLTIKKGECLQTGRHGRCVKRARKTLFWFTIPKCPPSGRVSILAFYRYAPPTPNSTKTIQLACPKFTR
jgi:hypothetical protein